MADNTETPKSENEENLIIENETKPAIELDAFPEKTENDTNTTVSIEDKETIEKETKPEKDKEKEPRPSKSNGQTKSNGQGQSKGPSQARAKDPSQARAKDPRARVPNQTRAKDPKQARKRDPKRAQNKEPKAERGNFIRDFFKKKKDDKKFFLKVGIGIGVVLLLIIIIIVVAAVVPKGNSDAADSATSASGGVSNGVTNPQIGEGTTGPPEPQRPISISSYHMLRLGSSTTSLLAIDDASESYVIQVDEEFRSIYTMVKFKTRTQIYAVVQKTPNRAGTDMLENTILFCVNRGLESAFTGEFMDSRRMEASGTTHYATINRNNVTITSSRVSSPLILEGALASIFNRSCDSLTDQDRFQWNERQTACDGNQTRETESACPRDRRCPTYDTETPLSTTKACQTFKRCNYIMGRCDRFWTERNPYPNLSYCNCRQTLAAETNEYMCPDISNDGGDCEAERRRAFDRSNSSPCLCHYAVPRIFPYLTSGSGGMSWRVDTITVTGPSKNREQCTCQR